MLTNTIMACTLVPPMKHSTVINNQETDGMKNMIHCCTIKSAIYTSAPT